MKYAVLFEDNDEFAHMRPKYMADPYLSHRPAQIDPYSRMDPGLCRRQAIDLKQRHCRWITN